MLMRFANVPSSEEGNFLTNVSRLCVVEIKKSRVAFFFFVLVLMMNLCRLPAVLSVFFCAMEVLAVFTDFFPWLTWKCAYLVSRWKGYRIIPALYKEHGWGTGMLGMMYRLKNLVTASSLNGMSENIPLDGIQFNQETGLLRVFLGNQAWYGEFQTEKILQAPRLNMVIFDLEHSAVLIPEKLRQSVMSGRYVHADRD